MIENSSRRARTSGIRRYGRALAAASVVMGTALFSFVAAPSANADTCCGAAKVCFANYFCVWENPNYSGKWIRQIGNGDSVNRSNVGSFLNDQISSLWNRSGGMVCVYENSNYGGAIFRVKDGDSHHDLRNDTFVDSATELIGLYPVNDRISSWKAC
jgi:Peptidase inhibitor family I36